MAVEENVVLDLETAQAVFEVGQVVVVSRLRSPREGESPARARARMVRESAGAVKPRL
jgi:hypothetical protein